MVIIATPQTRYSLEGIKSEPSKLFADERSPLAIKKDSYDPK